MSPDTHRPNRQSVRYQGYNYASAGAYFVTVCTKDRLLVLEDDVVRSIVTDVWHALPDWFPTIALDELCLLEHITLILCVNLYVCGWCDWLRLQWMRHKEAKHRLRYQCFFK